MAEGEAVVLVHEATLRDAGRRDEADDPHLFNLVETHRTVA